MNKWEKRRCRQRICARLQVRIEFKRRVNVKKEDIKRFVRAAVHSWAGGGAPADPLSGNIKFVTCRNVVP